MTRARRFIYWALIIGASMLLFWETADLLDRFSPQTVLVQASSSNQGNWYRSYTKGPAIPALTHSLENGIPVIFGSSELAEDFPYQPYKYWPSKYGIPVVAFGDIGFQQMAVIAPLQMAASKKGYENGRVIVLISPQWFIDGKGIHPEVMNKKVFSPQNLAYLCLNSASSSTSHQKLVDYVSSRKEFRFSSIMLSLCKANSLSQETIRTMDKIVRASQRLQSVFAPAPSLLSNQTAGQKTIAGQWSGWTGWGMEKEQATVFEARACNNSLGVRDEDFDRYKAELDKGSIPKKISLPPLINNNVEYAHFQHILDELSTFRHKPLFVLLPLNPRIYSNTQILDPVMRQIAVDLGNRGFGILDLWSAPYMDGRLHDGGHPGALGWVEISEAALRYFGY